MTNLYLTVSNFLESGRHSVDWVLSGWFKMRFCELDFEGSPRDGVTSSSICYSTLNPYNSRTLKDELDPSSVGRLSTGVLGKTKPCNKRPLGSQLF